jgi:hypothetical protein
MVMMLLCETLHKVDQCRHTGFRHGVIKAGTDATCHGVPLQIEKTFRGKVPRTLVSLTANGRESFEKYRKQLKDIVDRISSG